jgi:hypothetical protein
VPAIKLAFQTVTVLNEPANSGPAGGAAIKRTQPPQGMPA